MVQVIISVFCIFTATDGGSRAFTLGGTSREIRGFLPVVRSLLEEHLAKFADFYSKIFTYAISKISVKCPVVDINLVHKLNQVDSILTVSLIYFYS
jgi:hypothetical protein